MVSLMVKAPHLPKAEPMPLVTSQKEPKEPKALLQVHPTFFNKTLLQRTHTHTHNNAYAYMHTYAYAYAHTHTHTHTATGEVAGELIGTVAGA